MHTCRNGLRSTTSPQCKHEGGNSTSRSPRAKPRHPDSPLGGTPSPASASTFGFPREAPISGVAAGSTQFAGEFAVSGTSTRGTYQGIFAGPNANELLIAFEAPYFYPERATWVTIRGIMLGRII